MKSIWKVGNVALATWRQQFDDVKLTIRQCGIGNLAFWQNVFDK